MINLCFSILELCIKLCWHVAGLLRAAQLVYFERPTLGDELSRTWSPTVLKEAACDTNIAEMSTTENRDDWEIFYTTGVYTKRLTMFWPETNRGNPGDWKNPDELSIMIKLLCIRTVDNYNFTYLILAGLSGVARAFTTAKFPPPRPSPRSPRASPPPEHPHNFNPSTTCPESSSTYRQSFSSVSWKLCKCIETDRDRDRDNPLQRYRFKVLCPSTHISSQPW